MEAIALSDDGKRTVWSWYQAHGKNECVNAQALYDEVFNRVTLHGRQEENLSLYELSSAESKTKNPITLELTREHLVWE